MVTGNHSLNTSGATRFGNAIPDNGNKIILSILLGYERHFVPLPFLLKSCPPPNFYISFPASAVCNVCFILHLQLVTQAKQKGVDRLLHSLNQEQEKINRSLLNPFLPEYVHVRSGWRSQTYLMWEWKKTGLNHSLQVKEKPKPHSHLSWNSGYLLLRVFSA